MLATVGAGYRAGAVSSAENHVAGLNTGTRMSSQRIVFGVFLALLLLAIEGCGKATQKTLGTMPGTEAHNILSVRAGTTPPQVSVTGVMIEKCPVAGCWFRLRDSTGVIKVTTKSAGFVVVEVPLETRVTVAGRVINEEQAGEIVIEAIGLRY